MVEQEPPIEHVHEEIHRHAEGSRERWVLGVALSATLLAALAAVATLFSGHDANEALLEQMRASDQWAYYQAKGIKSAVLSAKAELLAAGGKGADARDRDKIAAYEKQQEEIFAEAKGEEASEIYCLPADFVWNDLGCWSALHEHVAHCGPEDLAKKNIFDKTSQACVDIDSQGNYVYAPGKAVALVGVSDLVVVETDDALLITTRERSQDVGRVVAELKQAGREDLV